MYTWFRKGKAAVTSGSDIVRFTGATLTTDPTKPVVGDAFTIDGVALYEIIVIDSDNTGEFIKLQKPYGHTLFAVSVPFCEPSKNKIILSAGFQYNYHSK